MMAIAALAAVCGGGAMAAGKPMKVYILAGQSNMEGQGAISTFPAIGDDPKAAPLLKEMLGEDGKPVVCEKVWITYPAVGRHGKLTAGFAHEDTKIGPEFTFGLYMQKHLNEPWRRSERTT